MVESPFTKDSLRENYKENIENIPEHLKERYDYIWVAFLDRADNIPQFDKNGNENMWAKVEEKRDKVNSVFWIPIEDGVCYGIESSKGRAMRRSAIRANPGEKDRQVFYYMLSDGNSETAENILFISPDGEVKRTDDYQFNPESHWG